MTYKEKIKTFVADRDAEREELQNKNLQKNMTFEDKIKEVITDKAFDRCSGCQDEAVKEIKKATDEEIENRIRRLGVLTANCTRCGQKIFFLKTKSGRLMPTTLKLISHFADCPLADEFRKNKLN